MERQPGLEIRAFEMGEPGQFGVEMHALRHPGPNGLPDAAVKGDERWVDQILRVENQDMGGAGNRRPVVRAPRDGRDRKGDCGHRKHAEELPAKGRSHGGTLREAPRPDQTAEFGFGDSGFCVHGGWRDPTLAAARTV